MRFIGILIVAYSNFLAHMTCLTVLCVHSTQCTFLVTQIKKWSYVVNHRNMYVVEQNGKYYEKLRHHQCDCERGLVPWHKFYTRLPFIVELFSFSSYVQLDLILLRSRCIVLHNFISLKTFWHTMRIKFIKSTILSQNVYSQIQ